jgi:hypothetical protein
MTQDDSRDKKDDKKADKMPVNSGLIKDKPVYDHQKNRTDSLQMPINYYIKQKDS